MSKKLCAIYAVSALMLLGTTPAGAQEPGEDKGQASLQATDEVTLDLDATEDEFDDNAFSRLITPVPNPNSSDKAVGATACFQLHNGAGVTWYIDAKINVNAYPFVITGGLIKGTICNSPNWALTGGSVGAALTINGMHTGIGPCAATTTIVGNYGPPSAYTGTYGFNGLSTPFRHRTLFLGYNRPTCP